MTLYEQVLVYKKIHQVLSKTKVESFQSLHTTQKAISISMDLICRINYSDKKISRWESVAHRSEFPSPNPKVPLRNLIFNAMILNLTKNTNNRFPCYLPSECSTTDTVTALQSSPCFKLIPSMASFSGNIG